MIILSAPECCPADEKANRQRTFLTIENLQQQMAEKTFELNQIKGKFQFEFQICNAYIVTDKSIALRWENLEVPIALK